MKILNLLFIIFSIIVFGQNSNEKAFIFDHSLNYIKQTKKGKEEIVILVNSKTPDYYLIITKHENQLFADLKSFGEQRDYFFEVEKNAVGYDFKYFNKGNLKKITRGQDFYVFEKKDSANVDLKIYEKKNLKKVNSVHHLITVPNDFPLFYAFKIATFYPVEDEYDVFYPENILVKESEIECKKEITATVTLKEFKKVDVKLNVPTN